MAYSKEVLDHYNNPQNVGRLPKDDDLNFGQRRKVKFKTDKKLTVCTIRI